MGLKTITINLLFPLWLAIAICLYFLDYVSEWVILLIVLTEFKLNYTFKKRG